MGGQGRGILAEYVAKQFNTPVYTGKRALDFTPFEEALSQLTAARIAEIETLLANASIADVQGAFAAGTLSARELTVCTLYRIRRDDADQINSILELNPDALQIAEQCDAERAAGKTRGALHGIPLVLKDNIATHDQMHTTAGAAALAEARPMRDAFIVTRLREAGAVILGKANMSEWAYYMTTSGTSGFSALGGQVHNPRGEFDVSGSSSGSAAAVSAGLVLISVGTETTGSIVAPASQNGVVGLKPSVGLVSRDQIIPISPAMDTAGPMARNVTDAALLLNVLAGDDPKDIAGEEAASLFGVDFTQFLDVDGLRGKRVGILRFVLDEAEDEALYVRTIAVMQSAGAEVVEIGSIEMPDFELVDTHTLIFPYDFRHNIDAYLKANPDGAPDSLAAIIAFNAEDATNRAPFGMDLMTDAQANTATRADRDAALEKAQAAARLYIREKLVMHGLDVLVSVNNSLSAFYAPAGFPALTVPGLYRSSGEPVGMTFTAEYLSEPLLLRVGYAFEQALKNF